MPVAAKLVLTIGIMLINAVAITACVVMLLPIQEELD